MSKYTCFRCNRIFRRKDYLTKHLQRKFPCKDANLCETSIKNDFGYIFQNNQNNQKITKNNWLNLDIKNIVNTTDIIPISASNTSFSCKYCNKEFKYKCSVSRHINTLRCNKIPKKVIKNIINTCKNKEIVKIKNKKNNKLINISNTNSNNISNNNIINNTLNNNNINTINNNNIHINLNPFGKENLNSITKDEKIKVLNEMFLAFPKALEKIHYKIPENNNFFLTNKNNQNFITLYNGEGFIYEHSNKFKDKLCNNIMEQLEDWFNEYKSKLLKNKKKILKQVFEEFYEGQLDEKYYKEVDKYLLTYSDNIKTILKDTIKKVKENNIKNRQNNIII
jgi:hypothetical protein